MDTKLTFLMLETSEYEWIKNSSLYDMLKNDFGIEEKEMNQPLEYVFCSKNEKDFTKIFSVCSFWNVTDVPIEIINLIKTERPNGPLNEMVPQRDGKIFEFLQMICNDDGDCLIYAIKNEHLYYIEYYLSTVGYEYGIYLSLRAAKNKTDKVLKFLHKNNCSLITRPSDGTYETVCEAAALGGSIQCLKYAKEHGSRWGKNVCINAAISNSLECLKFAHENGRSWDRKLICSAINSGSYDCLKYACENGCELVFEGTFNINTPEKVECMKYFDNLIRPQW